MVARDPDTTGVDIIEELEEIGYDYIELSLAHLMKARLTTLVSDARSATTFSLRTSG
jgi:hypothetical protein